MAQPLLETIGSMVNVNIKFLSGDFLDFLDFIVCNSWKHFSNKDEITNKFSCQRVVSVFGLLGALFMLGLGMVYFSRIQDIEGFTEIYHEYSSLLFYIGTTFLIYAGVVVYFKLFKGNY